jgi:acyl-homoserine lactone synthase
MAEIVTKHNSFLYVDAVRQMYRLRHKVFVEQMGWEEIRKPDQLERDQFDTEEAIYLLVLDDGDRVIASLRFLPTLRPHTLSEIFPQLCNVVGIPVGPRIYEVGRLCVDNDLPRTMRRDAKARLMVGSMEFALMSGIEQLSFIGTMELLNLNLSIGWKPEPLGVPDKVAGATTGAFILTVGPRQLERVRQYFALQTRLVTYIGPRPVGASMVDYVPMPDMPGFSLN